MYEKQPPKFICRQCGQCCSHIRGMMSEEEKKFLKEYAYGKLPLVQLVPIEKMSFPLFDFEAKRFKIWEKEVNIDAKLMPSRVVLDLNSEKSIIVTYYMDYDGCPFLKGKKCLIYDKKRAFICRLFPFNRGLFLGTGEKVRKEYMFGSCPAIQDILPKLDDSDKKRLINQLYQSFGEDFLNMTEYDYLTEWINRLIINLIKDKKIRAAMNYPYNYLLKRIANSKKIDLMDFLVEEKIKTKEEVVALIDGFDNNTDAKKLLNNLHALNTQ